MTRSHGYDALIKFQSINSRCYDDRSSGNRPATSILDRNDSKLVPNEMISDKYDTRNGLVIVFNQTKFPYQSKVIISLNEDLEYKKRIVSNR